MVFSPKTADKHTLSSGGRKLEIHLKTVVNSVSY